MSRKLDNTRIVTFKEDYKIKGGRTIYEKGSTHAIHHKNVELLKKNGAKMEVKELDQKKAIAEAKKKLEQAKKAELEG